MLALLFMGLAMVAGYAFGFKHGHTLQQKETPCERGDHKYGKWTRDPRDTIGWFQHRDCEVCGFRDEEMVGR